MQLLDWIVLSMFFLVLISIGIWAFRRVSSSDDFFVGGGKIPWWLAGISHHVSGYSGVVFVGFAGLAYNYGFSLYIWWALTIGIGISVGAFFIAPQWAKLRLKYNIQSPTEYLALRYNVPVQQLMAWSGVLLKVFDMGAKWAAIALILNVFTGLPLLYGIVFSGGVSLIYITIGGLWADVLNDFAQFIVQIIAGLTMFFVVISKIGGFDQLFTTWSMLPEGNDTLFKNPYTVGFAVTFLFINFLSYNGGTWNLAMRFIAAPSGSDAKKSALLSAALYFVWPLVLFLPMWLAPVILPNIADPEQSYALLAMDLLPPGLVGLVLAGMFANTMSMTASDSNTISSVITRDILPKMSGKIRNYNNKQTLLLARITTFSFTLITLVIAFKASSFGGVLGLIITWFAALLGPVAIPMLLGLLPAFKRCGVVSAFASVAGGFITFTAIKYFEFPLSKATEIASPMAVAFVLYILFALVNKKPNEFKI